MQTVELIRYLYENGSCSADELSRVFHASVRTVRAHVHNANDMLADTAAIVFSRMSRGYRLDVEDFAAFEAWMSRNAGLAARSGHGASEERVAYLLNDLLPCRLGDHRRSGFDLIRFRPEHLRRFKTGRVRARSFRAQA